LPAAADTGFTQVTLTALREFALARNDGYVIYAHSKGALNPTDFNGGGARSMFRRCIEKLADGRALAREPRRGWLPLADARVAPGYDRAGAAVLRRRGLVGAPRLPADAAASRDGDAMAFGALDRGEPGHAVARPAAGWPALELFG